uniref:Uncharacterized protein n=1 Tax=Ascaris lumbricoides TaxID=6252 RepID=A0A0M3HN28_ASCLU
MSVAMGKKDIEAKFLRQNENELIADERTPSNNATLCERPSAPRRLIQHDENIGSWSVQETFFIAKKKIKEKTECSRTSWTTHANGRKVGSDHPEGRKRRVEKGL